MFGKPSGCVCECFENFSNLVISFFSKVVVIGDERQLRDAVYWYSEIVFGVCFNRCVKLLTTCSLCSVSLSSLEGF